jgi:hypothetical protein
LPRPEFATPAPLSPLLPAVPTTQREFTRTSLVRAHFRIYQGGKAPIAVTSMRTWILDEQGATVVDRTESLGADRFGATRSADLRVDVPVASLAAGAHRLRIEASAGGPPVHRDVLFVVR